MLPEMRRAKRPISRPLAGPYGHPYHPALVSVPIGAWVASLVFDVASHFATKPAVLAAGSEWLIALGGRLAFRYGVRVADEATQADGYLTRGQRGSLRRSEVRGQPPR